MGLGLLLLTAGAFVRFVLGRYAGVQGVLDPPGAVLMGLGLTAMAVAMVGEVADRIHLVRADHRPQPAAEEEPDRS